MKKIYLHPFIIRVWHWLNALLILVLIVTGAELRTSDVNMFPDYSFVVALHKYSGYALAVCYLFWIAAYQIAGGFARQYLLSIKDTRTIPAQIAYYVYKYFRGEPNPFRPSENSKFNALQKMAYSFIMFVAMPLIIITGILFGNIIDFYNAITLAGGIRVVDAVHVIVGYLFVIYLIIHIYMATLGKRITSHTKAMITGYEEE